MQIIGVVPARFSSRRLPGKPLADILGKPMIWWVWQRARKAKKLDQLVIATDDKRILKIAEEFGAEALMTSMKHRSGTERVAEVAQKIKGDIFINIQGDQPLIEPKAIDKIASFLAKSPEVAMATGKVRISKEEAQQEDTVKVVVDKNDRALYFSRSPIPFSRNPQAEYWRHIGIYGYRRDFLIKLIKIPQTSLSETEGLEQLKALEYGFSIKVLTVESDSFGVDTREDLERVKEALRHHESSKNR